MILPWIFKKNLKLTPQLARSGQKSVNIYSALERVLRHLLHPFRLLPDTCAAPGTCLLGDAWSKWSDGQFWEEDAILGAMTP